MLQQVVHMFTTGLWAAIMTKIFPNLHINDVFFNIFSFRNLMTLLRILVYVLELS